jgi:selenide,water dikinase
VFTLDFFPPLVDDPATFGRIAATNALNDVFAMGGSPLLALSIAAFPEELPTAVLGEIFAAAADQVRAAGAILAGGHTIRDAEPKYGLAVVGTVHPEGVWPKSGARPGDALFLTKPLGTGLVLAAKGDVSAAVEQMTALNAAAADCLRPFQPNAVTDVTGFGLFGHAHEMADRSGVRIVLDDVPALPGALAAARAGIRTGGDARNREFAPVEADGVAEEVLALGYDAQTAGGLLVSLPSDKALSLASEFRSRGLYLARVGAVETGTGVAVSSRRRD